MFCYFPVLLPSTFCPSLNVKKLLRCLSLWEHANDLNRNYENSVKLTLVGTGQDKTGVNISLGEKIKRKNIYAKKKSQNKLLFCRFAHESNGKPEGLN